MLYLCVQWSIYLHSHYIHDLGIVVTKSALNPRALGLYPQKNLTLEFGEFSQVGGESIQILLFAQIANKMMFMVAIHC